MGFTEKAIFVWNHDAIGNAEKVTAQLLDAGFEAAYLHSVYLDTWATVSRVTLCRSLQAAGIRVYGSCGVYGANPAYEGGQAAALANDYQLAGFVFDAETTFDNKPTPDSNAVHLLMEYKAHTNKPAAWCWWSHYKSARGTAWHPVSVLRAAMQYADVGMPMAYPYGGDAPAQYEAFLSTSFAQWREVTDKPIVPAGRAYVGDGGTPNRDNTLAYEAKARALGAVGITWWSMEHAVKLTECWRALGETKGFVDNGGNSMWTDNVLIAAFNAIGTNKPVSTVDFAALKAAGIGAALLRCGTSGNKLNPDEPSAGYIHDPNYKAWFTAATAAGLRVLVDYDVNVMLDSVNGYNGVWTLRQINYELSGGFQPKSGGGLLLNCERNTWLEGGDNREVTCTSVNYGRGVNAIFAEVWNQFKLVPGVRTGNWFLDKTDTRGITIREQMAWMDKGDANIPLIFARWKKTGVTVTGNFHDVIADIPDPAMSDEQSKYLYFGNITRWMGWELATVKHAAVKDSTGAAALFRLILWRGNAEDFDTYFNFVNIPPADTVPPTMPTNFTASVSGASVTLTWGASTDNVGVTKYSVWRDGSHLGYANGTTYTDSGVPVGTHNYEVSAVDAAGNNSARALVSATVGSNPPPGPYVTIDEFEAHKAQVYSQLTALTASIASIKAGLRAAAE